MADNCRRREAFYSFSSIKLGRGGGLDKLTTLTQSKPRQHVRLSYMPLCIAQLRIKDTHAMYFNLSHHSVTHIVPNVRPSRNYLCLGSDLTLRLKAIHQFAKFHGHSNKQYLQQNINTLIFPARVSRTEKKKVLSAPPLHFSLRPLFNKQDRQYESHAIVHLSFPN